MPPDPATDGYLRLIEARPDIDGRFTNLRRVGQGGGDGHFSLILEASDSSTNRTVAIKVFRPDRFDPYRFNCFCREAELLEKLKGSPNILGWVAPRSEFTVMVQTTTGIPLPFNFPYFAVELASSDVGTLIRTSSWSSEEKLIGFREMCKAVQRIHGHWIVHRDIKPSNFLVMSDGALKLSDFGTARDMNGAHPPIRQDYTIAPGDTRYTAPEMLALLHDEDSSIAFEADFYALGATFFEIWSGTILGVQLFDASFAKDLARTMNVVHKKDRRRIYLEFVDNLANGHPLPGISAFGTNVPPAIRDIVDDLYRSLAALDFRKRLCDFERIFLKIDRALLVLRNEEKIRKWRAQKEVFRLNSAQTILRRRLRAQLAAQTGGQL